MTIDEYENLTINGFTLEEALTKFRLPTNITGAQEADETMEVINPTNKKEYSVGLIFTYNHSDFGDWKLEKKYVVETNRVSIPKYIKQ